MIFAWNRLGLPYAAQAVLAATAKTVVFGPDPATRQAGQGEDEHEDRVTTGTVLTWFPLVPAPARPACRLRPRIAELTGLAARPAEGTCHDRMSRAAEVLNKAALIASDCGVPALARDLCHRQHELFDQAAPLPAWAARLALQPLLNIPRQLIREGHGEDAYAMLEALYHAARERTTAVIDGLPVDLGTVTCAPDGHKTVCTLTWAALLADGTRALALAGRWGEAADHTAAAPGSRKPPTRRPPGRTSSP